MPEVVLGNKIERYSCVVDEFKVAFGQRWGEHNSPTLVISLTHGQHFNIIESYEKEFEMEIDRLYKHTNERYFSWLKQMSEKLKRIN